MTSGLEIVIFNSRERALSTDLNRLQSFFGRGLGELLRELLNTPNGTDDLGAGALPTENLTVDNPLKGEILSGLLIEPQVGTLSLSVHAGIACLVDPEAVASSDDSPYKIVQDEGAPFGGTLTMTLNSSGSTRVDVVECQRVDLAVETDSRDLFDPSTGLFTAVTVTKAIRSQLTYRVRLGTPGSGFPGTATGWIPLAVATVPNGTTLNDTMTFWDVRPLLSDRSPSLQPLKRSIPQRIDAVAAGVHTTGGMTVFAGHFDAISPSGRRLGGRIRRGTPGTDSDTVIDLTDVANHSPDVATGAVNGNIVSLCLLTPFGLPRWARYTDAAAGQRVPRSPRGIPVMTSTTMLADGTPSAPVVLPVSLGFLSAASQDGVAIFDLQWAGGIPDQFYGSDSSGYFVKTPPALSMTPSGAAATLALTAGVDFPANARSIHVLIVSQFTSSGTDYYDSQVSIGEPTSGAQVLATIRHDSLGKIPSGDAPGVLVDCWLPVESVYPSTAPSTYVVQIEIAALGGGGGSLGTTLLLVNGWKY